MRGVFEAGHFINPGDNTVKDAYVVLKDEVGRRLHGSATALAVRRLPIPCERVNLPPMCGRYTLTQTRLTHIEAALNRSFPSLPARYNGRGRNADYSAHPAQIRTGEASASGSYLEYLASKRW